MDQATPQQPKPSRRRAAAVTAVFAVVLGGVIYYLWTNHAYLKWRFIGGEVNLMDDCLATGYLSPDQVVTLVNSGATAEVRTRALGLIGNTWKFTIPFDDRLVRAIRTFAAELPSDESERAKGAHVVAMAIGRSGRPELVDVLEPIAGDEDVAVRSCVALAFIVDLDDGGTDLGDRGWGLLRMLAADTSPDVRVRVLVALAIKGAPEWATAVVAGLLGDTDTQVRRTAIGAAARIMRNGKGTDLFAPRIRQILDSSEEDERVRSSALRALCNLELIDDEKLGAMLGDPQERVVEAARELIKERAEERERAREDQ